ncbi:MAG: hypothetical protein M1514_02450 [Patescibacteria group bacterium]|nr:hypothetical protein [Patescibacteria group bacterium]
MMFKKICLFFISLGTLYFVFGTPAYAVCPVCTIAIGGGVLLSRYLGVDDLIIGVWIGGLILSLGLWTASYLKKTYVKGQKWLITAFLWVTTILGLKEAKLLGHPLCKIFGYDKLLVGIISGTVAFLLGYGLDQLLRKMNKEPGKALFPYQRVVCPVGLLLIATLIAWRVCVLVK